MKNKRIVNFLFIGSMLVLAVLAVIALAISIAPDSSEDSISITNPTLDVALSVTQTVQAMVSVAETELSTSTLIPPTATLQPSTSTPVILPDEFYIIDFRGTAQDQSLGCEARTAVDLAAYYGVDFYESDFQSKLPLSDNPDLGFVGPVDGPWGQIPPYAYGVHAAPVASLLNEFGVEVEGGKGYTFEQIKTKLAEGKPVIVWVIGRVVYSKPEEYVDKQGNTTIVAPYEHVVILTGYNENTVRFVSNGRRFDIENETFLNSWGVLGNMAVMHK